MSQIKRHDRAQAQITTFILAFVTLSLVFSFLPQSSAYRRYTWDRPIPRSVSRVARDVCDAGPGSSLRTNRTAFIVIWIEKPTTISNQTNMDNLYDTYGDPNISYSPGPGYGLFKTRLFVKEYNDIIFQDSAISPAPIAIVNVKVDIEFADWITDDYVFVTYTANISAGWNLTTQSYNYHADGQRYGDYILFQPCSVAPIRILSDILIPPPIANFIFTSAIGAATNEQLCDVINGFPPFVPAACPIGNSSLQQYTSIEDCTNFMNAIPSKSICPFPLRSNTTFCRSLHLFAAENCPFQHCQHTGKNSVPCRDDCLPTCSNCSTNGFCAGTVNPDATVNQFCQCKDGYTGDGYTCTANQCNNDDDCPSKKPHAGVCNNGICGCLDTFQWNTSYQARINKQACYCNSTTYLYWPSSSPNPICIPVGNCYADGSTYAKSQCPSSDWNSYECVQYGVNPYIPYYTCVCNPGYAGGFEIPCECFSPKTTKWSNSLDARVCLASGECTDTNQCSGSQTCHILFGQRIGTCSS